MNRCRPRSGPGTRNRSHANYLADAIPGAELIILPGVSHFAPLQRPDEFNATAAGWGSGATKSRSRSVRSAERKSCSGSETGDETTREIKPFDGPGVMNIAHGDD